MGDRKRETSHAARHQITGFAPGTPFVDGQRQTAIFTTNFDGTDHIVADKITSLAPAVPEPATMLLLGSGLIGLAGCGRKKFFKK